MCPRPVPGDRGARFERYLQSLPRIESRPAHLREIPIRPEIARPHLGIALEPAAGKDHRFRAQVMEAPLMAHAHTLDAAIALHTADGRRLAKHCDPVARPPRL